MTCEQYWRDGILRVERDEPDLHRETCDDCQREHRAREEILRALPLIAAHDFGDPNWEAGVWKRIARLEARRTRGGWFFGSMVTTACMIVIVSWMALRDPMPDDGPQIEIVSERAWLNNTRSIRTSGSADAALGDHLRITAMMEQEIRIYHEDELVLCCPPESSKSGCVFDRQSLIADATLKMQGSYALLVITPAASHFRKPSAAPPPKDGLGKDLSALADAGFSYQLTQLWVP